MTLEKAIQILKTHAASIELYQAPDLLSAIKLAIEALKRCKALAKNSPLWVTKPLPGEIHKQE